MKRTLYILFLCCFFWSTGTWAAGTQSTKTVNNILTEVRYALNESTADFWSDTELISHINQGIQNLAARTRCYEVTERYTLSSGTSTYAINVAYIAINDAIHQSAVTAWTPIQRGERTGINLTDKSQNYPAYYYEANGKIGFYPIRDTTSERSTGTTAYVTYMALPVTQSGTSTVPIPGSFDRALVNYAIGQALFKIPAEERAKFYLSLYEQEADRFRLDFKDRPRETLWDVLLPRLNKTSATVQ